MGPTWVLSAPGRPHVGPTNLAIRGAACNMIWCHYHYWMLCCINRGHLSHFYFRSLSVSARYKFHIRITDITSIYINGIISRKISKCILKSSSIECWFKLIAAVARPSVRNSTTIKIRFILPYEVIAQSCYACWRHQMETFSALLAIFAGNSPVPSELQRPVSFHVFVGLPLNKPLSKQWWGWWFETLSPPLWRHCNEKRLQSSALSLDRLPLQWMGLIEQGTNLVATIGELPKFIFVWL